MCPDNFNSSSSFEQLLMPMMDTIDQMLLETAVAVATCDEQGVEITDMIWFTQLLDDREVLKQLREQFSVPTITAETLEDDFSDSIHSNVNGAICNTVGLSPDQYDTHALWDLLE